MMVQVSRCVRCHKILSLFHCICSDQNFQEYCLLLKDTYCSFAHLLTHTVIQNTLISQFQSVRDSRGKALEQGCKVKHEACPQVVLSLVWQGRESGRKIPFDNITQLLRREVGAECTASSEQDESFCFCMENKAKFPKWALVGEGWGQ